MLRAFRRDGQKGRKNVYDIQSTNILSNDSTFLVSEAYKAARTNIMFSFHEEEGCKSIVCTSAVPGEGKTTTCVNMAISFAQTGAKVVLIDADMRKPKVARYLNVEDNDGLSDYLAGFVKSTDKVIRHLEEQNMDCITAGSVPPNPVELLGSESMDRLLDKLEKEYDYIFLDTPPVNVVTDAMVLAKKSTGAVLVVKENHTTHAMLENAIGALRFAEIRVFGLIMNGSEIQKSSKYSYKRKKYGSYDNGYGYGYGYGYSYGTKPTGRRRRAEDEAQEASASAEQGDSGDV